MSFVLTKYYGLKENDICLKISEYRLQNLVIYKVLVNGKIILCEKSNLEEL